MKKVYNILLIAVVSMTLVSCDGWTIMWDTPPYLERIVGSWESYYAFDGYQEWDIWGYETVRYDFYYDNTGRYYFYSALSFNYIDFEWETSGSWLKIRYDDGCYEDLYYGFDDYGDLMLSKSRNFYNYVVYGSPGIYYQQGKTIDPTVAKKFDPAIDKRPETSIEKRGTKD